MTNEELLSISVILLAVLLLIYIVITINLIIRMRKMEKNYKAFMKGADGADLESVMLSKFKEFDKLKIEESLTSEKLDMTCETLVGAFQKVGIHKYDAVGEQGGKLSYSICLLNDRDDGFIITSIYSKDGSNSYIKEIIRGQSYVIMSTEERKALEAAQKGQQYADLG